MIDGSSARHGSDFSVLLVFTDVIFLLVTHLVIPDVPMPTTVKCMMALLTGCWVLKFECKYEICGTPWGF